MQILQRDAQAVEQFLRTVIEGCPRAPRRLMESIEYSLLAGGKRLRPALVLEAWRACGGLEESQQAALAAAAAIELVHTFSLVHDDLPAMDDDDLRRGRPTHHKVFGEAMAILAGDAMLAMAFDVLVRHAPAPVAAAMVRELSTSTGPEGMIGGQVLDIEGENRRLSLEQLQDIHRRKTGALLTSACRLGALAAGAGASQVDAVTTFGRHLGLAFQIVDDILDVTSSPEQLGKATHKDKSRGKNTYPNLLGIDESRAEARRQLDQALSAARSLGEAAGPLARLAEFVLARTT
jgi:geranylgeranyl diphosphate synthase, type II